MRRLMHITATALVLLLMSLAVVACGSPEPTPTSRISTPTPTAAAQTGPTPEQPTPTPEKEPWEIEWEQTLEKALEEGEVVVVGSGTVRDNRPVFDVFEERFGITVKSSQVGSTDAVNRLLAERAAGQYTVDVFAAGTGTTARLIIPNGLLTPFLPQLILPEVEDPSNWHQGHYWWAEGDPEKQYGMAFAGVVEQFDFLARYNTNNVTPEEYEAINSIWDFLDPRWKGRIISRPPTRGRMGYLPFHPDVGTDWLERFFGEMEPVIMDDERLIIDSLILGAFDICLCSGGTSALDDAAAAGAPIGDFNAKRETWGERNTMTMTSGTFMPIMDRAPNPNAVRVFINWFYSKEGQEAYHVYSARPSPKPSLRVDIEEWGHTVPEQRVVAGKDVVVMADVPGFDLVEGLRIAQEIYAKYN